MFKLYGRVTDVEFFFQDGNDSLQDFIALRWRDVRDAHVAAQGMGIRPQAPDMHIMDTLHPFDPEHGSDDLVQAQVARKALEQNVQSLPDDVHAAPQNQPADEETEDRIDSDHSGFMNEEP